MSYMFKASWLVYGQDGKPIVEGEEVSRHFNDAVDKAKEAATNDIDRNLFGMKEADSFSKVNIVITRLKEFQWEYPDATGVMRRGVMEKHVDLGGTDITYFFRRDNGQLDLVSGSRIKKMRQMKE